MPDLQTTDIVLLALMVPLLVGSGFFSASETVIFGLDADDRAAIRGRGGVVAAAIEGLMREPRLLLISILLGNMTINTLYMTLGSVLVIRHATAPLAGVIFGLGSLAVIIVFGEVVPKLAGQAHRTGAAAILGPPIAILHRLLRPVDRAVSSLVVEPLHRLIGPVASTHLDADELAALVDLSRRQGAIDREEEALLQEVLSFRSIRVRDIMTPRVSVHAVAYHDPPDRIRSLLYDTGLRRLPVYGEDLDSIVGVLPSRRFLLALADEELPDGDVRSLCRPVAFVPEMASVEQLLGRFRDEGSTIAIVVDEFGGTAGLVTIEDIAEEVVGEIAGDPEDEVSQPVKLDTARWRVDGRMPVHSWREAFGPAIKDPRISTVGGLFLAQLGRLARPGDEALLANVRLIAERVEHGRVESALVELVEDGDS